MPLVYQVVSREGLRDLAESFSYTRSSRSLNPFENLNKAHLDAWLTHEIAKAFNEFGDIPVDPTENVALETFTISKSTPIALTIIIAGWWSQQRAANKMQIEERLEQALRGKGFTLSIEVHINLIGSNET